MSRYPSTASGPGTTIYPEVGEQIADYCAFDFDLDITYLAQAVEPAYAATLTNTAYASTVTEPTYGSSLSNTAYSSSLTNATYQTTLDAVYTAGAGCS